MSFASALLAAAALLASDRRPNVVFILADDLGWTDLGCQGSGYYRTPHLDRMAKEGKRFTAAYTCGPNCQPTRAALMTGQYGPRTGVYTVGGTDRFDTSKRPLVPVENVVALPLDRTTVADSFASAGYVTGMFGKWHLGEGRHAPDRRGFHEALVTMGRHFDFATNPSVELPTGTYLADYLTDRAVDFIERNKDRQFFLYLPHFGVHGPHQAKPEKIAQFKGQPAVGGHRDPTYAAMIASVDDSVGRVRAKLAELKLDSNTLVIFSSDNGGVGGYARAGVPSAKGITDNAPLRGGKGMLYEGGIRVPFIAAWPGRIAAATLCDQPIASVDLHPTILQLAVAKQPAQPLDGTSILPLLFGDANAKPERTDLFWHFPGYLGAGSDPDAWRTTPAAAIRSGDFKLIEFFETGKLELYNLRDDIGETNNLAASRPELVKQLHDRMKDWRQAIQAPMPTHRDPNAPPAKPAKKKKKRADRKATDLRNY